MAYNEASQFSGYFGHDAGPAAAPMFQNQNAFQPNGPAPKVMQEQIHYHGEALARDSWAEQYGSWLVLGFTAGFALFLIVMELVGQVPGKSFALKSASDIFQFIGESIGFILCARIALRLQKVSAQQKRDLLLTPTEHRSPNALAIAHSEAQATRRAFLAWAFLAIGIALYAAGQAVWTSYDVRMNSASVPFPGIYDIGFVCSYPFFLIGTLFLTRRNKATVGRARLILDALAVIGAALALSWFFLLSPVIAGLAQSPSAGASFLSIYFPTGDLFLVAVGAFLMFSPLANRSQQPVFMLLCLGLICLAVTDSLLAFYNLSGGFNTGTVQDILWPLSLSLIGLAAVAYPRSVAHEQAQADRLKSVGLQVPVSSESTRLTQFTMTAQTIAPFLLALGTCALLLTDIAPRGGSVLVQADLVALALMLIVIVRQSLTLLENNRLATQMRGELVISRRELQVTRREADEATRTAQEKQILDEGIATLREVHARVARGDMIARAPTVAGPLLPIAASLNLMLDRISALSQRGAHYDQIVQECRVLLEGVERLGQGLAPWTANQPMPQSAAELRSVFMGLSHVHRIQENHWRRVTTSLESMESLTHRIAETLNEIRQSPIFKQAGMNFETMILERVIREINLLSQQQANALSQIMHDEQKPGSAGSDPNNHAGNIKSMALNMDTRSSGQNSILPAGQHQYRQGLNN